MTSEQVAVRRARTSDRLEVADILADAFVDDPVSRWVMEGRRQPRRDLRIMFGAIAGEALRRDDHHVYLTDDGSGAAVCFGVDRWKMAFPTMVKLWPTAMRCGFAGRRSMQLNSATQKAHPRAPHFYVELIGTRPDHQGRGVGSLLLRTMLEACDAQGVGAYLESSNPKNIPFYWRHGFRAQPTLVLPPGCPTMTPMWRDPS